MGSSQLFVRDAREWLLDIFPIDDDLEILELSEPAIWRAIDRYYDGGIIAFARDGDSGEDEPNSRITTAERWAHPTTADIYSRLDVSHCGLCERWAVGRGMSWEIRPNSALGRIMLDAIGSHILAEYAI